MMEQAKAGPGRPRDAAKDDAILAATRRLLAEAGYQQTTIAAIARAAQVNAPAVYRRWPTRRALIEEAVHGTGGHPLPPDSGSLGADLRTWVRVFLARAARPAARAGVPGLLADAQTDESRAALTALGLPVRRAFDAMIARAQERGEAPAGVDSAFLFGLLADATSMRGLQHGMEGADDYIATLAGALRTLIEHGAAPAPETVAPATAAPAPRNEEDTP